MAFMFNRQGSSTVKFTIEMPGSNLYIYWCATSTPYRNEADQAITCGANIWLIANQPYSGPDTPIASTLYGSISSADAPPAGTYNATPRGASPNAVVADTPLPVELTSFEPAVAGRNVRLNWTTASETNNAGFSVEMKEGEGFVEKGFVAGQGTTLEAQRYSFDAGTLLPGTYTFRLRQVDFDGVFEYSPEVEVAVALDEPFFFSAPQPNPMRAESRVHVSVQQTQKVSVRVYDLLGREVETLMDGVLASGEARTLVLERGNLPAGLYLIQLQGSGFQSTRQVTLL